MSSGWIVALEIALVLGLALTWGFRELRSLRILREQREAAERATETDPGKPRAE